MIFCDVILLKVELSRIDDLALMSTIENNHPKERN